MVLACTVCICYTKVGQITCSSTCTGSLSSWKMWVISHEPLRPYSWTCILTGPVRSEFQSLICVTLLMRLNNPPRLSFEQLGDLQRPCVCAQDIPRLLSNRNHSVPALKFRQNNGLNTRLNSSELLDWHNYMVSNPD